MRCRACMLLAISVLIASHSGLVEGQQPPDYSKRVQQYTGDTRNFLVYVHLKDGPNAFTTTRSHEMEMTPVLCGSKDGGFVTAKKDPKQKENANRNSVAIFQITGESGPSIFTKEEQQNQPYYFYPCNYIGKIGPARWQDYGDGNRPYHFKYDVEGNDPRIYFGPSGEKVKGERWRWAISKLSHTTKSGESVHLFNLIADEGKFAGYYVDCDDIEEVCKDEKGLEYLRWRTKLVKEPGKFSNFYIKRERQYPLAP